jgi:LuxR family maltose regulon positive regulatory protein
MPAPLLLTKLYIPPPRPGIVPRPSLIERLNEGLQRKLTLISAPAGFGKTTLVSEWIEDCKLRIADFRLNTSRSMPTDNLQSEINNLQFCWLSLDEGDNDPARFLTYLVAALQTIAPKIGGANIGAGALAVLQSPQPPSTESILTTLLNEITTLPDSFMLVLDDYHLIEAKPVDQILVFLLEHLPPQMHLVIASREDPPLPLARYRARSQLTELRAADLRFTPSEAAEFLNHVMGLNLSTEDIAALEARTEGWITGMQLAALSMQGRSDSTNFIQAFTGSHHFVLDYLVEEVLQQQSESVQTFLLRTSILDRLYGPLCDAVLGSPSASGQEILEYLEHANLFIVPLDNERRWYRYHHLFAELLRQRLNQSLASLTGDKGRGVAEYHIRASEWYENNDLMLEAFRHAVAAGDIERAERLMESKRMPLHLPGTATEILKWLESLPKTVLDAEPALWWKQASLMLVIGQTIGVEEKLQATEAALAAATQTGTEPVPSAAEMSDEHTRNLIGKIAVARATLAQNQAQTATILVQARRALEYLHPNNLSYRSTATRTLGFAYYLQGDWAEAGQAYAEALSMAQAAGDIPNTLLATTRLGQIQELRSQLFLAAESYQNVLQLIGDYSPPNSPVAYLGLARIYYEWNDLNAAEQYGDRSLQLARQYDQVIDRLILSELFLAGLKLARRDVIGAARIVSQTEQTARQKNYTVRLPDIAVAQVIILLRQGNIDAAAQLARQFDLPLMQARVLIAQHDPSAALAVLEPLHQQAEARGWVDRLLRVMAVQSVAFYSLGEKEKAVQLLGEALALAEPGGFIRLFVDEGEPMRLLILDFRLWIEKQAREGRKPIEYVDKLLAAFSQPMVGPQSTTDHQKSEIGNQQLTMVEPEVRPAKDMLVEPLSERELEVLRLLRTDLNGPEIARECMLSLSTVRTHTQNIYAKLGVNNRRAAVRRAEELNLL